MEDMPGLIPAELSAWMEDRQADVQEALLQGNHSRVIELSSKGAERMVEMTRSDISDDEFRSRGSPRRRLVRPKGAHAKKFSQVWSEG